MVFHLFSFWNTIRIGFSILEFEGAEGDEYNRSLFGIEKDTEDGSWCVDLLWRVFVFNKPIE